MKLLKSVEAISCGESVTIMNKRQQYLKSSKKFYLDGNANFSNHPDVEILSVMFAEAAFDHSLKSNKVNSKEISDIFILIFKILICI